LDAVILALTGSDRLLMIDEAETLTPGALECVRRISDIAGVGVVLAGTLKLYAILRDKRGKFGQISSRVAYWGKPQKNITRNDCYEVAKAYMADDGVQLRDDLLEALYVSCDGSTRVLTDGLIPGLRDYIIKPGHELTPKAVYTVAGDILGYGVN